MSGLWGLLALLLPIVPLGAGEVAQGESGPIAVPCGRPLPVLRNAVFNLQVGTARLRDGSACLKSLSEDSVCEWSVKLKRVEMWGPGDQLLLVVIHANHETGSGAWDSVFLFACDGSTFVPLLSRRYLYGTTIVMGNKSEPRVTSGVWELGDPSCCPSREREEHYVWNAATRQVTLTSSRVTMVRRRE